MHLRNLVLGIARAEDLHDERKIAIRVFDQLSEDDYPDALRALLPGFVADVLREKRNEILLAAAPTAEKQRARREGGRSRREGRTRNERRLTAGFKEWLRGTDTFTKKAIGDVTVDEWFAGAEYNNNQAKALRGMAKVRREYGYLLQEHGVNTLNELPDEVLAAVAPE